MLNESQIIMSFEKRGRSTRKSAIDSTIRSHNAKMPGDLKLLMIAFEFPPQGQVGVQRSSKFAKYLQEYGIRPIVVTTDGPSAVAWLSCSLNEESIAEIPKEAVVYRVPCPRRPRRTNNLWVRRLRRLFSMSEENIGKHWEPHLIAQWYQLIKETKPDALYVSVPPFSMGPLAVKLALVSRLPLIIDFRDGWSHWYRSPYMTRLHYLLTLWQERTCLRHASIVIGTTDQIISDLQSVHQHIPREKFHVIPNGYDGALPASLRPQVVASKSRPFVIGYVGSFYYSPEMRVAAMGPWWRLPARHWMQYSPRKEDWLYRSPFFFFKALKKLVEKDPALHDSIRVKFVGDTPDWLVDQIKYFSLQGIVEHLGRLPHRACLEFQAGCDALLATAAKIIGGCDYSIAGKTFEYVTAGCPVIAFVTEGEMRNFYQASGIALICDPDDTEWSANALERIVTGKFSPVPNLDFLQRFHRSEASGQLARLFKEQIKDMVAD